MSSSPDQENSQNYIHPSLDVQRARLEVVQKCHFNLLTEENIAQRALARLPQQAQQSWQTAEQRKTVLAVYPSHHTPPLISDKDMVGILFSGNSSSRGRSKTCSYFTKLGIIAKDNEIVPADVYTSTDVSTLEDLTHSLRLLKANGWLPDLADTLHRIQATPGTINRPD